jgi:NIMA (never in mitosis gene a)-related kinase
MNSNLNKTSLCGGSITDFQIICKLGEGSFSNVYKVKRISDGEIYAMKKVKMGLLKEKEKENALNEVRILASLNDTNIVSYKEAFIDDASSTLCVVMEFAAEGDIQGKVNTHIKNRTTYTEPEIWKAIV